MTGNIRVRFAPSPTGNIHIGNVRTAILNWLFARQSGGTMILRIEDTDMERSTEESERGIVEQLQWLGLDWDEGPLKGGEYGPYRQSERVELYREHVQRLIDEEKAYRCYLTQEEIDAERERAIAEKRMPDYARFSREISDADRERYEREGRKPVVRFRVPEGTTAFADLVQGDVSFENENIVDFVIQRQDGSSPYNFACAVDDAAMKISHVVRGNDHLSNTPKQVMLCNAFGYVVPKFAHTPMILGPDGARLSKRHGHTSVGEFRENGYLPEALLNYLSLLSWSSESGDEILSKERLVEEFTFDRINRSPAKFDPVKLNWMNGIYIRALDPKIRMEQAKPFLERAGMSEPDELHLGQIVEAGRDRVETFKDYPTVSGIFFTDNVEINGEEEEALLVSEDARTVLMQLVERLERTEELTVESFQKIMKEIQQETGIKGKNLWMPVRVGLTGQMHGPELPVVLELFGKEKCLRILKGLMENS